MPKIDKPFVAVITPLYNDVTRIRRAIETVHNQTFTNYVHFICDDGSTDGSRNFVHNHIQQNPEEHIVFASLSENGGQSNARNTLLHEAFLNGAEYIAFLDSDDYWIATHLADSIEALNKESAAMVYSSPMFVDDNSNPQFAYNIPVEQEPTYDKISKANSIYISSVVMKRVCAETVGEFDSDLDCIEDWDYWLRVIKAGFKIVKLNTMGVFYLIRTDGMAGKSDTNKLIRFKQKHMIEDTKPIKLNLGCGDEILDGYINCDMDSAKADMLFDAAKIPFPDNSIDEIRAYHLIEHFPFQKGLAVLREWFRVLKPHGKLVMETPDLLNTCKTFVESNEQERIVLYGHFFAWPDLSIYQTHFFLFTETQMRWSLESTGFVNFQRVKPDSIYAQCNPRWEPCYLKVVAQKPAVIVETKPLVYDCFLFYNELDLLELRLNELNGVVDKFVLVEGDTTFTGKPKPYYYAQNKERFKEFSDKIIHVMVKNPTQFDSPWDVEIIQRNSISDGLGGCKDNDIIMISDVDEIPNVDAIKNFNPLGGISLLEQKMSFYYMNCVSNALWWNAKIGAFRDIKKETPYMTRLNNNRPVIQNGGWHFTALGGVDAILNKLAAFSHTEYNTEHFRDEAALTIKIRNGVDIYERGGIIGSYWNITDEFPKYLQANKDKYIQSGYIRELHKPELPIAPDKYDKIKEANHSLFDEVFIQGGYMMYEEDLKDSVFVDVGANIGVTAIKALSLGANKILAFEPESNNRNILTDLMKDYDNVIIYPYAVYNSAREIHLTNEGMLSNMFTARETDELAPAVTLEEVNGLLQKGERGVLKLDCEGGEFDIIYNAPAEAVKRFDMIFFEIHNDLVPQYLNGGEDLIKYVTSLGFDCHKLPFSSGVWYPDGHFEATYNTFYKCKNIN